MKPAFSPSLGTFEGGERGGNCSGLKQTSWNICGEKKWKNWIWKKWKQNFSVAYNSKTWRSKTRSIGRMGFQSFWDFYLPCKDYWLSWDLMALYQGAWETSCFASGAFVQIFCSRFCMGNLALNLASSYSSIGKWLRLLHSYGCFDSLETAVFQQQ